MLESEIVKSNNSTEAERTRLCACSTCTDQRANRTSPPLARERIGARTLKPQVESTRSLPGWLQSHCALMRSWPVG